MSKRKRTDLWSKDSELTGETGTLNVGGGTTFRKRKDLSFFPSIVNIHSIERHGKRSNGESEAMDTDKHAYDTGGR